MGEAISAFQNGVAFRIFDRRKGYFAEMGGQAVGLYPGKYDIDMPTGEDPVEAIIFANCFSTVGGQYPCKDF